MTQVPTPPHRPTSDAAGRPGTARPGTPHPDPAPTHPTSSSGAAPTSPAVDAPAPAGAVTPPIDGATAPQFDLPAEVKDRQTLVRDPDGHEVVSSTQVSLPLPEQVPLGSLVTVWAGTAREREAVVLASAAGSILAMHFVGSPWHVSLGALAGILVAALMPLDGKESEAPIGKTVEGEA